MALDDAGLCGEGRRSSHEKDRESDGRAGRLRKPRLLQVSPPRSALSKVFLGPAGGKEGRRAP